MLKLATWNINGIRARSERLRLFLERHAIDVLCLQETKVVDEDFPHQPLREAGYHAAYYGQKSYNGVAILAREELGDVVCGMGPEDDDPQCRLISATVAGVRVVSAYFPNGRTVGSEEYEYKLRWIGRLREFLAQSHTPDQPLALLGDFNVAPDDHDVARPDAWRQSVLCHDGVRQALAGLSSWGLSDVFRAQHPEGGHYSWWDYRMLAFPKNNGLRIDHVFATPPLAARCQEALVDRDERKKGTIEKPSDHAPVIAVFA